MHLICLYDQITNKIYPLQTVRELVHQWASALRDKELNMDALGRYLTAAVEVKSGTLTTTLY